MLPWRNINNPYGVFVSEIMLQQTQVDRVVPKYILFIELFPNFTALSQARLGDVLNAWSGLGYNRRGKYLHESAKIVVHGYDGVLPDDPKILETLPGIGKATAASICAFGFNKPTIFIETNIRSVMIDEFFSDQTIVDDAQIIDVLAQTLDHKQPNKWYSALMDYGSYLKSKKSNPNRRSRQYAKQSKFEGSDRQLRGKILKMLIHNQSCSIEVLAKNLFVSNDKMHKLIDSLNKDGLVSVTELNVCIADRNNDN